MEGDNVTEKEIRQEKRKAKSLMSAAERIEEQKALHKAKELEQENIPTSEEELKEVEEFAEESEHAKSLLKPAWYLKKSRNKK